MRDLKKQNARQNKWKSEHQDAIRLCVPKGMKAVWQAKAQEMGISLTEYIISKVEAGN